MPKPGREASYGNGNGSSRQSKWGQALASTSKVRLTWAAAGAEDVLAALVAVTEDGAALLLSKTSDGGALMLQVIVSQDEKPKFYAADMATLNEVLFSLAHVE